MTHWKTSNTVQDIQWILRIKGKLLNQVVKLRKIALILYELETPQPVILHLTKVAVAITLSPFLNNKNWTIVSSTEKANSVTERLVFGCSLLPKKSGFFRVTAFIWRPVFDNRLDCC